MQARLIAYPPDQAAVIRTLEPDGVLRVGREAANELVLDHPSVSRRHARIEGNNGAWRLHDEGSKNGSFVDGMSISSGALSQACWLRFGDVYCEFTPFDDALAGAEASARVARRAAATAHTVRIGKLTDLGALLDASVSAVMDLAQCGRGFALMQEEGGGFSVRSSLSLDPTGMASSTFAGSVGAVRRAIDRRRPVIVNDVPGEAWLSSRASVSSAGLSTLVCLPLLDGDRVLGVIYADRVGPGPAITTLDLELLEAFAENAALWIAARRASDLLEARHALPWQSIVAAHEDP
ncbi:FHA domain-containing protein [Lysobacter sp. A3-1-A15]|uniref:FHA domain-containing protein n=1 Tax=Novilysobacter viscosus TaxID=3098602 RepID=UPI002EDB0536